MEIDKKFIKCEYSIQDLEQFRDEKGFIDLSAAGVNLTEESREIIGNPNRIKNWVNFNGKKALIKGEAILDEEQNYGIYAELIVEEMAKCVGQKAAHYDLIKMQNDDGNTILGVLSESVIDLEKGEQLVNLYDIIGDEPEQERDFIDTTTYEFTITELRKNLLHDGYTQEQVENVINDYNKRLAFIMAVIDTDKYPENIAFIKRKNNGKDEIEISPNIDSESALLLDNEITVIKKLLDNYYVLKESVNRAHPRIGTIKSVEEDGFNSFWMDSLEELCEDDEVYYYCSDVLREQIDMDSIFEKVEKRIKAKLPEEVKLIAKYSYNCRNEDMVKVIDGEIEQQNSNLLDKNTILDALISRGVKQEKIRANELINMEMNLENNLLINPFINMDRTIQEERI